MPHRLILCAGRAELPSLSFELPRLTSLTRQELRAVCDRCKTQEEIIRAITAKE